MRKILSDLNLEVYKDFLFWKLAGLFDTQGHPLTALDIWETTIQNLGLIIHLVGDI